MTGKIVARMKRLLPGCGSGPKVPILEAGLDLREEYANAFRTESYDEFWARVLALSDNDPPPPCDLAGSTTAARLSSYRLFVEHLLEPDQPAVIRILDLGRTRPAQKSLLAEYFSETAKASLLCGALLKEVDRTRVQFRSFKSAVQALSDSRSGTLSQSPSILGRLTEFSKLDDPSTLSSSTTQIQSTQAGCSTLLSRLELTRNKAKAKLKTINNLRQGSATFLIAVTASLTIVVMVHGLAMLVAAPAIMAAASLKMASAKNLRKVLAQLDAATKGTYILMRDMDTISRLVARIDDELEHMRAMVRFWLDRGDDKIRVGGKAALGENQCNFAEQVDELEEHLYLCFMTINRARNLVVKELLDPI